ncbi:hypothetical protein HYPSUDRAFT_145819 [Hypholoma sublateritium FD-334 SS-4]|uniref:ABC transporter substrate-binding protein n=1 Tax=Hypholoma sublateritium (strain FD-334 SS-4) TaxID=945553 RepID=A0A0D2NFU3_HYPSF|nr:hypothetical protein HYPSUDRAFT_145819 [Hypholoma sublateritium FD-334 SS-4]
MVRTFLIQVSVILIISSLGAATVATSRPGPHDLDDDAPQAAIKAAGRPRAYNSRSVDIENRTIDEIYNAAMKEQGTLRVSWGGDVQASKNDIMEAFTARFPNIKVNITLDVSKYLDSSADLAYNSTKGKDNGVDVTVLQSVQNFPRWKSQGRLLPYKVAPWNDIQPEFVDPDGAYTGLYIFTLGDTVYNSTITNNATLPKTYLDCLLPEWKHRIVLTYPNDDDAVLFLFKGITEKYGFDYLQQLQQQNVSWVRGTATPSILIAGTGAAAYLPNVAQNAGMISFASSSAFTSGIAVQLSNDAYMSWPQTGAIFATTKMPESSRLFLSFLMDDQWQEIVSQGRFATRRKYDGEHIMQQKGHEPTRYVKFMSDRQKVEEFRFQIEKVLGTAQGIDPVELW